MRRRSTSFLPSQRSRSARSLSAKGKKGLVVSPLTYKKVGAPRHRADPFSQLFCAYGEGMTPLMAAMTFARASIVTKLLDAGADVKKSGGLELLGDLPCHFRGAILAGRLDNMKVFLDRYPEYVTKRNAFGSTVLHFACFIGRTNDQLNIVKDLLARGPASNLRAKNLIYGTPLQTISQVYDSDPAAIKLIMEAGPPMTPRENEELENDPLRLQAALEHARQRQGRQDKPDHVWLPQTDQSAARNA